MTMTLDEAIQHCEEVADTPCFTDEEAKCYSEHRQLAEWLKELKAYKENTCGDAISREAVLNAMYELCDTGETLKENPWRDNPHIDGVVEAIEELPSVTPQQRTGRWILADEQNEEDVTNDNYRFICSECQCSDIHAKGTTVPYCWNCGAKMEVEE